MLFDINMDSRRACGMWRGKEDVLTTCCINASEVNWGGGGEGGGGRRLQRYQEMSARPLAHYTIITHSRLHLYITYYTTEHKVLMTFSPQHACFCALC